MSSLYPSVPNEGHELYLPLQQMTTTTTKYNNEQDEEDEQRSWSSTDPATTHLPRNHNRVTNDNRSPDLQDPSTIQAPPLLKRSDHLIGGVRRSWHEMTMRILKQSGSKNDAKCDEQTQNVDRRRVSSPAVVSSSLPSRTGRFVQAQQETQQKMLTALQELKTGAKQSEPHRYQQEQQGYRSSEQTNLAMSEWLKSLKVYLKKHVAETNSTTTTAFFRSGSDSLSVSTSTSTSSGAGSSTSTIAPLLPKNSTDSPEHESPDANITSRVVHLLERPTDEIVSTASSRQAQLCVRWLVVALHQYPEHGMLNLRALRIILALISSSKNDWWSAGSSDSIWWKQLPSRTIQQVLSTMRFHEDDFGILTYGCHILDHLMDHYHKGSGRQVGEPAEEGRSPRPRRQHRVPTSTSEVFIAFNCEGGLDVLLSASEKSFRLKVICDQILFHVHGIAQKLLLGSRSISPGPRRRHEEEHDSSHQNGAMAPLFPSHTAMYPTSSFCHRLLDDDEPQQPTNAANNITSAPPTKRSSPWQYPTISNMARLHAGIVGLRLSALGWDQRVA